MLEQLIIQNIAVIEKAEIEFEEGLNVLTGETGAGKSIIIDSINAILGERISKDMIRFGSERASIEAVFTVEKERLEDILEVYGISIESDNILLLQREFTSTGRNICRINGRVCTVSILREFGQRLIDIHGQHENQSLLRTDSHIELLDRYGSDSIYPIKREYEILFIRYKQIKDRLSKIMIDSQERARKIDLLQFQIHEIENAALKENEDEDLQHKKIAMTNAEKIRSSLKSGYQYLFGSEELTQSAFDAISSAEKSIQLIAGIDIKYQEYAARLSEMSSEIEDLSYLFRDALEEMEYTTAEFENVLERLDCIQKLKRKYGSSISEILLYLNTAKKDLEALQYSEIHVKALEDEFKSIEEQLFEKAQDMNQQRILVANRLEERIAAEFIDLEMKGTRFKVDLQYDGFLDNRSIKLTQNGLNRVEFLISVNEPNQLKPLVKVASGGEMSRIMLAIKTILASVDSIPVLIFDEIDVGISGRAAQKVGNKLSFISKNHQVLCVTHLAQIAGMADAHYLIEKNNFNQRIMTKILKLNPSQQIDELARIIGGELISDVTLQLASEMIENAKQVKNSF